MEFGEMQVNSDRGIGSKGEYFIFEKYSSTKSTFSQGVSCQTTEIGVQNVLNNVLENEENVKSGQSALQSTGKHTNQYSSTN